MIKFIIILVIAVFLIIFIPFGPLITARASGVKIGLGTLIGMRFRHVPASFIVNHLIQTHKAGVELTSDDLESYYLAGGEVHELTVALITVTKAGIPIQSEELESHALAGGDVINVANALVAANQAGINLDFREAAAIDLAGRDVLEAVEMSVTPKIIETPKIAAVAKDGIAVIVTAKVTVQANIEKLIGGAGRDTVIARVGEGIVTTVGSSEDHSEILENPDHISNTIIEKGLDAGTAFKILSIDIADVDVGKNIGARLNLEKAEADKKIAQAKAEERKATAIALEQENRAKAMEARSQVIQAQAKLPEALAAALKQGNIGVYDYMQMKNIKADTKMREGVSDFAKKKGQEDKPENEENGYIEKKRFDES